MLDKGRSLRDDGSGPRLQGQDDATGEVRPSSKAPPSKRHGGARRDEGRRAVVESQLRDAFERNVRDPLVAVRAAISMLPSELEPMKSFGTSLADVDAILGDVLEVLVAGHSGGLRITRRPVDLRLLCERVLDAIQPAHPESPLRLVCTGPVQGSWDPDRIASLLSRLVKNAIQHGALRRTITVSVEDLDDRVLLEVKNFGPSLHDDVTDHLFEPFVHGDADPGNHRGLGVGLYLAKEIVRAHGGNIEARSDAGGVVVRAHLPRLPVLDSL